MNEKPGRDSNDLLSALIEGINSASSATQSRLFHGLVPAVASLRDAEALVEKLEAANWFRGKRRSSGAALLRSIRTLVSEATQTIETRAAECGYPLEEALASFHASGAGLGTVAAMETALAAALAQLETAMAKASALDWDAWAAGLVEDSDDSSESDSSDA